MSRSTVSQGVTATAILIIAGTISPIRAPVGDFAYGRITEVKRADVMVFAHAAGTYTLRVAGIVVPKNTRAADSAANFVRGLVLNRTVRIRLQGGRLRTGEFSVRVLTTDPVPGIKDVAIELVRAGLVVRQRNFDFKYGELARAEAEARRARRGVWQSPR